MNNINFEDKKIISKEVSEPDENNIKTVTETFLDEETGKKIIRIRKYRVIKRTITITKGQYERRKWRKYGDSKDDNDGSNPSTTSQMKDTIEIDFKKEINKDKEEIKVKKVVVCRNCGEEGHWTSKCLKEKINNKKEIIKKDKTKYIPPHLRGDVKEKEEYTVRISNLPQDITREEIHDMADCFGRTERVHLVYDRITGLPKEFAFITFCKKIDGDRMIKEMDGYPYHHMILSCEWAKKRE